MMVFYEITAKIQNLEELLKEADGPDRVSREFASGFGAPAKKVFEESDRQCCVFLKTIKERTKAAVFGAIAPNRAAAVATSTSSYMALGPHRRVATVCYTWCWQPTVSSP